MEVGPPTGKHVFDSRNVHDLDRDLDRDPNRDLDNELRLCQTSAISHLLAIHRLRNNHV